MIFVTSKHLLYEFFFYHDNNYVIYIYQGKNIDRTMIKFMHTNGHMVDCITIEMNNGKRDHSGCEVLISPSGRYLFFVTEEEVDDEIEYTGHVVEFIHPREGAFALKEIREIRNFDKFMKIDKYGGMDMYYNSKHNGSKNEVGFFLSDKA